jgi:DNA-binding GntR family transcriptional regulator
VHRIEQAQREHRELYAAMKDRSLVVMEDTVKKHNRGALVAYTEYLHADPVE